MAEAIKGNKVYTIDKVQAAEYAAMGYDVYEGAKLIKHALNKTVPYAQYEKALAEIDRLKKQLKAEK